MKNFILTSLFAMMIPLAACTASEGVDNSPIKTPFVLERYLGTWYEIARYDHSFERDVNHATAVYAMRDDGKVAVVNSGWKNGKVKSSVGKAKTTKIPAVLKVSFFGPFYSEYRILMLTPDYQYAVVGSSSSRYLWILSRTPQVPPAVQDAIMAEIHRRGYDTSDLIWVDQSFN